VVYEQNFSIGDSKFAIADISFPIGDLDVEEKIIEYCYRQQQRFCRG
jgi:hypothetical protein